LYFPRRFYEPITPLQALFAIIARFVESDARVAFPK
jgi:hypothetical protein